MVKRWVWPPRVVWLDWLVVLLWAVPGAALRVFAYTVHWAISAWLLVAVAGMVALDAPRSRLWPWHEHVRLLLAWLAAAAAYSAVGVVLR